MRPQWLLAMGLCLLPWPAVAQILPEPGPGDPRMQSVLYDPDQVVQLQVANGYQLAVEFAPGEQIENVAVGDSSTWQVTPNKRGDHLFIKMIQSGPSTNLTVLTDARSYSFELLPAYGGTTPFTVRFRYAPPAVVSIEDAQTEVAGRYRLSGAKALRPNTMSDDGVRTYISWDADQAMPAVFAIDDLGKEVVVDGAVREGQYVIDNVSNRLTFRLGKQQAGARRVPQQKAR